MQNVSLPVLSSMCSYCRYNGSITPLLLNAFTWASRGDPMGGPMYATFKGKHAVVMGASPGALGGLRAMSVGIAVIDCQCSVAS